MKKNRITIFNLIVIIIIFLTSTVTESQLQPIFDGNNIGYIDSTGKIAIPCDYDSEVSFELFSVAGKMIIDFRIPAWARFNNGSVTVKIPQRILFFHSGYLYAMIDANEKYIFKPQEDMIFNLSEGIAIYKRFFKNLEHVYDFDFSYIEVADNIEKFITQEKFSYAGSFNDGIALVIKDAKYKYINREGTTLFDINKLKISAAEGFSEGLAVVKIDSLYGYINTNGELAIPPKFRYAYAFSNGVARVFDGNYYAFIDKSGKNVTAYEFAFADNFSEGLALVKKNDKIGFIDTTGKVVIPFDYVYAQSFSEGAAVVYHNGSIMFIDKKGELIINKKFDFAQGFKYGLAKVWKNDELHYINKKGDIVYTILNRRQYKSKQAAINQKR